MLLPETSFIHLVLSVSPPVVSSSHIRKHFVAGWGGMCAPVNSKAMPAAA
jgi:hypothetical protein